MVVEVACVVNHDLPAGRVGKALAIRTQHGAVDSGTRLDRVRQRVVWCGLGLGENVHAPALAVCAGAFGNHHDLAGTGATGHMGILAPRTVGLGRSQFRAARRAGQCW